MLDDPIGHQFTPETAALDQGDEIVAGYDGCANRSIGRSTERRRLLTDVLVFPAR